MLTDSVDQLYDDLFVETAAPWALPYLGDLIGYRLLGQAGARSVRRGRPARGDRAHHRVPAPKGTASMLEQLRVT